MVTGTLVRLFLQERQTYYWVHNDYGIQTRMHAVLLAVENGQDARGIYLGTSSVVALNAYTSAIEKALGDLSALEILLVADPRQTDRLSALRKDLTLCRDIIKKQMPSGKVSASSVLAQEAFSLEKAHRAIDGMKQAEAEKLEHRIQATLTSQRRGDAAMLGFLVLVSLLLAALVLAVRRDLRHEREAEKSRHASEKQEILRQVALQRNHELQTLARRMVELQESERRRLAYELHEEVGQVLTGLKLVLGSVLKVPEAVREKQVEVAQEQVTALIRQVRALSLDLRPGVLDDFGLAPALEWYRTHYQEQANVQIDLHLSGLETRLDETVETTAYRIVQEALANVAHHNEVKQLHVSLTRQEDALAIEIRAVGSADTVASAAVCDPEARVGIQERAALIGGSVELLSETAQAKGLVVCLPLEPLYTSLAA